MPDVLLTLMACRRPRAALVGTGAALAGALIGGALMYAFALRSPSAAVGFLERIPGISPTLVARVGAELSADGLRGLLAGPLQGIPYKVYAVDWGARGGSFGAFVLVSAAARYVRFLLATVGAGLIARLLAPWTRRSARLELTILAAFWLVFYRLYFTHFGW